MGRLGAFECQTPAMIKRIAALPFWYFAAVGTYFVIADITNTPRMFGFVVGAAVALFVFADPAHLFWTSPKRTEVPTSELRINREAHRSI